MRGSVVVEQGEVDWDNIVGQAVVYCCRRQKKKGNVATKVWVGGEEEQAEHVNSHGGVIKVMRISLHICISLHFSEFLCISLHFSTFICIVTMCSFLFPNDCYF